MLNVSETWLLTRPDLQRLRRNDRALIRQICNVKPDNVTTVRLIYLLAQLEIDYIVVNLREKRLRWFVHNDQISGAFKTVCDMQIEVERGPGRPKTAWMTLIETLMSGNTTSLTLVIGVCENPMGDLPCVQLASYLEGAYRCG